jgi:phosphoribosylanthranilate isomerase
METHQDDLIIKVCGITSVEDALMVVNAGAHWLGLNFWRPSPRYIATDLAREIIASLPGHIQTIGVFVDEDPQQMAHIANACGLHRIQLHGGEPPQLLSALPVPAFKAMRIGNEADIETSRRYLSTENQLFLVDARHPTLPGGTGLQVSERLAKALQPLGRMILAGGLTPQNVGGLVSKIRPAGVDTASGVESAPGRKDPALVQQFVEEALRAHRLASQPD